MENAAGAAQEKRKEEMSKLNPCPNCGSEPDIFEYGENHSHIYCTECGDPTEAVSRSVSGAINAWNSATGEQPIKTLRDEFAMAVLIGIQQIEGLSYAYIAGTAYGIADAMLKERSK